MLFPKKHPKEETFNENNKRNSKQKRTWTLKLLFCSLLTVFLVGLISSVGLAQTTFTWDGSTDNDWTDETNWDQGSGYPGDTNNEDAIAVIDIETNIPDIPAGLTFATLTINSNTDGDDLEVSTLGALTLTTLNLQVAAASATATDDADLTLGGNLTVSNINITVAGAGDAVLAVSTYSILGSPTVAITTSDDGAGTITCSTGTLTLGAVTLTADDGSLATGDAGITFTGAGTMTASSLTLVADPSDDVGDAVLTGAGATITISGAVSITDTDTTGDNGYAVITSSGTLSIGGDLTIADGGDDDATGIASSGTVVFNGSAAQTITLTDDTESDYSDFEDVQISNSHASGVILANYLYVDGTLTVDANSLLDADTNDEQISVTGATSISGTVTVGTNDPVVGATVTIASGGALTCNTTDAWTPGQNIIINGTLTWNCTTKLTLASLIVGSDGNAVLSNTGEIEVTGTSSLSGTVTMSGAGTLDFDGNVTIAGAGGITVSAAGTVEVDDDIDNSAGGNINMTAGTISFDGGDAAEYTVGPGTNTLNTTNVSAATPLTISGSEGILNIDGALTPAAGTADITGGSNVTFTFSGNVDLSNDADLQLSGPVNFDSSATITLGTGTISFGNSSNDITIDDPNSTTAVVLTISDGGSGGLITFAGDLYIGSGNDTTTDELTCAQGDVTINIGAGKTVTNEGILDLDGAVADKILIASNTVNSAWYLDNSDGDATIDMDYVAIRDCSLTTNGSELGSNYTAFVNATGNSGWTDVDGNSLFDSPVSSVKRALDSFSDFTEITGDTVDYYAYVSRESSTAIDAISDLGTKYLISDDADSDGTPADGDEIHGEDLDASLVWDSSDLTSPAEAPKGKYYLYLVAQDESGSDAYVVISDYTVNVADVIVVQPLSLASTADEVFTSYLIQWDDNDDDATIDIRYSTQSDLTMLNYADNSTRIATVSADLTTDQYRWDCSSVASDSGTTYYIYLVAINESGASLDVSDGLTVRGIDFTAPADSGVTANTATVDSDSYDDQTENILSDHKYYHLGWTDYEDDITNDNLDVYVSQNLFTSVVDLRAAYSTTTSKTAFRVITDKNPGTDGSSDTGAESGSLAANASVAKWDLTTGYGDDGTESFPEGDYYIYIIADDNNGSDSDGDDENDTYDELVKAPGQVTVRHDPFFYTANDNVTAAISGTTTGAGSNSTIVGAASLSSTDDYYNNAVITITSGTYSGESRIISDYTGGTKTVTVSPAFSGAPGSGVTYRIYNILSVSATADSGATADTPGTVNLYWKGNDIDDSATIAFYAADKDTDYSSADDIETNAPISFATGQAEYNYTGVDSSGNNLWDYYSSGNLVAVGEYYVWAVMTDTSGDKAYKKSAGTITISHSPKISIDNPPTGLITTATEKYYTLEWTDVDYDDDGEIDIYFSTTDQLGGATGGELASVADRSAVLDFTKVTTSSTINENDDNETDRYGIDLAGVGSTKISDGDVYYFYVLMDVDDDGTPDAGYQSGRIVVEHQTSVSITSPATDALATTNYTISWLQKWNDEDTTSMDVDLYYDTTKTKTLANLDDNIGSTNAPSGIIELNVAMDGSDDDSRYDESRSTVWDDIVVTDTDGADQNASASTTVFYDTDLSGAGDDYYNGRRFVVTAGGLEGESGTIQDYVSSSGKFTLSSALSRAMNDDETTEVQSYKIYVPDDTYYVYAVLDVNDDNKYYVTSSVTGTTDGAGSTTTLVDSSGLSTIDDYYNGCRVTITDTSNDSYGQSRVINDYEGDGVGGTAGTITISQPFLDSTGADTTVGSGVTFSIDPLETYSVSVGTITISNYTIEIDTPDDYQDINQVFNVDFNIDTNGQAITGLNLHLDFNTDTLELDNPSAPFSTVTSDTTDSAGNTAGTTINGSSSLSSVDDYYNDYKVVITSGICKGESRTITDYDSSANTLTVNPAFSDRIDSSVTFEINQSLSDTNNSVSSWTVYVVENDGNNTAGTLTLALLSTNPNATAIASSSSFVSVAFKAIAAGDEDIEVIFDDANSRMTKVIDNNGEEHIPHVAGAAHVRTSSTTTATISGTVELQSYAGATYPQMTFELRKPGVYGHYSGYTSTEDEDSETIGIQLTPGDDGSFTLTQVPAGKYFLTAKSSHYLRGQNDDTTPLEIRPGETIEDVTIYGYNDANSDGDYADSGEEYDYLLAGDTNSSTYAEDNAVTAYDVTNLVNNYGTGGDTTVADIDGDGDVDIVDFKLISNNWGVNAIKPTSGAAGVNNSAPAAYAEGIVEILGLPDAIYLGDEINVQVAVKTDIDAIGFGLDLEFDAEKIKLSQVQEGDFFAGKTLFVNKELDTKENKKLSIGSATFDKASHEGALISFKLVPTAIGDLTLKLNDGKLIGKDEVVKFANQSVIKVLGRPTKSELLQNYPNPFNPETWIPFVLKQDADVTIRIYNVSGQLVKTLNLGQKRAEHYIAKDKAAYWDGRNAVGERVASGIYFYQIQAGKFNDIKRMVILK